MSVSTSTMSNYTDAINNLPEEAFLGSLLWFSISAADVDLEAARGDLTNRGLSTATLRKNLRPVDAFRKAAREAAHKFKPEDGIYSEILVRPATDDSERAVMFLMLERRVDQAGKKVKIFYEKVGELNFTRGVKANGEYSGYGVETRRTTMNLGTPLTESEDAWLTNTLDEFGGRFDHLLHNMDSHAVRTFVRDYITDLLSGTLVKESGGLYFVKQEHADIITELSQWVRSIGSQFHSLPLLNLTEQRQMIMDAFEDETVKEVERLMGEVAKILTDSDRQIEEKTFDAYALRAAELKKKVAEYNGMLGSRADRASTEIGLYSAQIMELVSRIRTTATPVT